MIYEYSKTFAMVKVYFLRQQKRSAITIDNKPTFKASLTFAKEMIKIYSFIYMAINPTTSNDL